MSGNLDRRSFIKNGAIFVSAALAAPSILFNQGCTAVLHAPKIWRVVKVLGGFASALAILDYLDIKPDLKKQFSLREASQCLDEFLQDREKMWQDGINVFIGINRSPLISDVAVMIGTNTKKSNVRISLQVKGKPSIKASNGELNAIKAATDFIAEHYKFSEKNLVKATSLTGRRDDIVFDGNTRSKVPVVRFDNALGGHILYTPTPPGEAKRFTGGTVSLYQPNYTDPKNQPFIGLEV